MTTAIVHKSSVKPSWAVDKFQAEASSALTGNMIVTTRILKAASPELLRQVRKEWANLKVEYFRGQGVKTPLDLVRVWTEFETNMFGSKMQFWGDENQAHVEYLECSCWSVVEKIAAGESEKEAMSEGWAEITQLLAKAFGFTGTEKIGTEPGEACCTITFTR